MSAAEERLAGYGPAVAALQRKERARLRGTATASLCAMFTTMQDLGLVLDPARTVERRHQRRLELAGERGPIQAQSWPVDPVELGGWLGESVAVDDEGNPRPFYHGTVFDFTDFDSDSQRRIHGEDVHGFYFTHERRHAEAYGDIVLTAYLRMVNPKRLESREHIKIGYIHSEQRAEWEAQGFDGVVLDDGAGSEYVVFHPSQIRVIAREPAGGAG